MTPAIFRKRWKHLSKGFRKRVEKFYKQWVVEFLEKGGLGALLESLKKLSSNRGSVAEACDQLQCVACLRTVTNSESGLDHIVRHDEYSKQLANVLSCQSNSVKLQVFELLCALCMYSTKGHSLALSALNYYKSCHGQRFRFDLIVAELKSADTFAYQATLVAFINCLIVGCQDIKQRIRIRNEFYGVGLGDVLTILRDADCKDLQIQIKVFETQQEEDEKEMEPQTHQTLFDTLFKKVASTPHAVTLQFVLMNLIQLEDIQENDKVWEHLEEVTSSKHWRGRLGPRKAAKDASTQTFSKKFKKKTSTVAVQVVEMPLLEVSEVPVNNSQIIADPSSPSIDLQVPPLCSMSSPTPLLESPATTDFQVPVPPHLPSSDPLLLPPPPPPLPPSTIPPPPPPPPLTPGGPSPFDGGSPPPPPPPPLTPAESSVTPSPPPPPGLLSPRASLPCLRRAIMETPHKYNTLPRPSRKMKTINWTKLPKQMINGSVWDKLKGSDVEVDFAQLDELFCQPGRPKSSSGPSISNSNGPGGTSSSSASVHLLDSKRSLALSILLKQFKDGPKEVIKSIEKGSGLKAEILRNLVKLFPEKNELAMIRSHPCEPEHLAMAEKFYLDLSNIENYELRVNAMLQKEEVPTAVEEFEPQLTDILNCCESLMENSSLREFLALILQLGNYLNAGSYAGDAVGFRLSDLPKLLETRANLPRVTFLHYVVQKATSQKRDSLEFTNQLQELRGMARTPISAIEEEIVGLSQRLKKLETELESCTSEIVKEQFTNFVVKGSESITQLQLLVSKVKEAATALATHFCEDIEKFQLEDCFNLLADFFDKTLKAYRENEERKRQEEQRERVERERLKMKMESKKRGKKELVKEEECLVDLLMQEIRGGTFKLRRATPF